MSNLLRAERLAQVISCLNQAPSSPERNDAIAELSKRISYLVVCGDRAEGSAGGEIGVSSGIKLEGDAEIHGNTFEPPVRPATYPGECRRRLQQVIKGIDPDGQFLTVEQDNRDLLTIRWTQHEGGGPGDVKLCQSGPRPG